MVAVVVPNRKPDRQASFEQKMQVMINVQAEVLDPELARRKANVWLLENVGNLLGAQEPELVLGATLFWRFDVICSVLNLEHPELSERRRVGQLLVDAATGEVQSPVSLIEELELNVAAIAP